MGAIVPVPEDERRCAVRYAVTLEGKLRVPLHETGTGCLNAKAIVENLSLTGALVHVPKLKREHVPTLVRTRRKCSISCHLPGDGVPLYLAGEIVWIDIHANSFQSQANLGVEFGDNAPAERGRLARFLEQFAKKR